MKFFAGLLVGVALCVGAYLWFQSAHAPRVQVVSLSSLPPQEQHQKRVEAKKVEEQVRAIARDAKTSEKKSFQLVVTQDQLNTLIQERLQTKNLPIANPRVGLQNGQLVFEADATYKGIEAPVSATGTVQAQNGDIAFTLQSLSLGMFPTPNGWKEKAQKAIDDGLKKALKEKGSARIESVGIGDGNLTLKGTTE